MSVPAPDATPTPPWEVLRALADSTRLRLHALLAQEELSVAELQVLLEMGQSRISSHLAQLRSAGLVADRREGKRAFYSARTDLPATTRALLDAAIHSLAGTAEATRDAAALERVRESRRRSSERYFNRIAGRLGQRYCPGRSWEAFGQLLLHLVPAIEVADLGAGEGVLSQLLARRARHVHCIDNSPRMIEVGTALAARNGLTNLSYSLGDIEQVPLPDASVDLAVLSQALHHAERPPRAVAEAFRILRPGGQLVVLDLLEHTFSKARELYADRWLGFRESALHGFLRDAGFVSVDVSRVLREKVEPHFTTVLASGQKPQV